MNTNSNIEELVGRYLEGEMSDIEKLNFEKNLLNNPEIQEEFQLQKDILEGINEYRKAELKARLDNISIPSSGVTQYLGLKIAALITITTMIGFGAYFAFVDTEKEPVSEVQISQRYEPVESQEMPQAPDVENNLEQLSQVEQLESSEPSREVPSQKLSDPEPIKVEPKKDKTSSAVPTPKIVKPDFVEDVAEENIDHKGDSFELNTNSLANVNKLENKVEVEMVFDKKKDFHYKFYNKKLYLYGDFEKAPYEIIEYNSNNNKLYFLYYEGNFYELEAGQMKTTPLVELSDVELISELELLRK